MKSIIKVVCGIIRKDDKIFIARRKHEKNLGGYWEFPGGKLEDGEEPITALQRELFEELGMKVGDLKHFGQHLHHYDGYSIELIAISCVFEEALFQMTDHDEYAFVKREELVKYSLAPADIYFVDLI